ncbi:MAG: energy transducer TonB [Deltaproteobacteria bacterium]|nr:energy transducer TonB [Deltaproteobacteria bacterium]
MLYEFEADLIQGSRPKPEAIFIGPPCLDGAPEGSPQVERLHAAVRLQRATFERHEAIFLAKEGGDLGRSAELRARNEQDMRQARRIVEQLLRDPDRPAAAHCVAAQLEMENEELHLGHLEKFIEAAPGHPAADSARFELCQHALEGARLERARAFLAEIAGQGMEARAFEAYLGGWILLYAGERERADARWAAAQGLAVDSRSRQLWKEIRRDRIRLLARSPGARDPETAVRSVLGAVPAAELARGLMELGGLLVERGEHDRAVSAYEAALESGGLAPDAQGAAVLAVLRAHALASRPDRALGRAWRYLHRVVEGERARPGPEALTELEALVRTLATECHDWARRLQNRRLGLLAGHLYVLYGLLPRPRVPLETRQQMAVLHAELLCLLDRFETDRLRRTPAVGPAIVRSIVRRQLAGLRACYTDALERKPGLAGEVGLRFEIDGRGRVGSPEITRDSVGDAAMASCILEIASRLRFPERPERRVWQVDYPLRFELEYGAPGLSFGQIP